MAEMKFIKHAMNLLAIEMNADNGPGSYRDGWVANLGGMIYTSLNCEPYNVGTSEDPSWISTPLDSTKVEDCEEIAERFLRLAFPDPEDK